MAVSVQMPALGESVTEGTVTRWLKQVGYTVAADEPILEISTDKVDTEIPAPASGTLASIDVAEDSTVAVGTVLGLIATGASAPAAPAPAPAPAPASAPHRLPRLLRSLHPHRQTTPTPTSPPSSAGSPPRRASTSRP